MKIAVVGCAHGELDKIYETIDYIEKKKFMKIELLIICGDFQAVRNSADLQCMSVPAKYRKLNTFYKYYSGVKKAPVLTIFIGGNHEASNFLSELPYGGWVCPNIYYLGYANVINIGGIRIAGLSGIYKSHDYFRGHFESLPYSESSKKSVYHVRNIDVFRLKQIKKSIDIFLTHDWPTGIYNFGNKEDLLRLKPYFRDDMNNNSLGSQPTEELLMKLKPSYWFAAHLHCKFAAVVPHNVDGSQTFTKFLALDKCLPRRKFLQVLDIESHAHTLHIEYDPEWLSVLHSTNHLLSVSRGNNFLPSEGYSEKWNFSPSEEEIEMIHQLFNGDFKVPDNFSWTAPPCYDSFKQNSDDMTFKTYINPQTEKFCKILHLTDPLITVLNNSSTQESVHSSYTTNPDEILLSDDDLTGQKHDNNTGLSECSEFFIDKVGSHHDFNSEMSKKKNLSFPIMSKKNTDVIKGEHSS